MGQPIPFVPFANVALCARMDWKKRQLRSDPEADGVHDGDTAYLFVDKGERGYDNRPCRFYGYDSPEIDSKDADIKAKAVSARDFLRGLILGKEVYVMKLGLDPHDRPIVLVWTDKKEYGDRAKSVNRKMLDAGHGVARYQSFGPLE